MAEAGTKKKSKKKIVLIIILAVVAVLIIGVIAIGAAVSKAMQSLTGGQVDVAFPEYGDITSSVNTSGTITSGSIVTYTTNVTAEVEDIKVRQGQMVKKGDEILTFDVKSLEDQLVQASLNARSTQLSGQSSIEASNKASAEVDKAKKRIEELNGQISAKKAEIEALYKDVPEDTTRAELEAAVQEKRIRLTTVLEEIQAIVDAYPADSDISVDPTYINKCAERDALSSSITNMETILKELPDASATISYAVEAKNAELATLQSELATQQSIVSSGEAGLLTNTQREQLNIANQLSNMQVQSATTMLEEGRAGIKAEQNGIVTSIAITKGSTAAPGYQLFTIADMDDLRIRVSLSKKDIEKVSLGQKATITALGNEYEGEVTYISHMAEANASGGTGIETEITIKNPDQNLILGLDAKVIIHTDKAENVMTVPNLAVNVDNDGTFVYVVEDNIVAKKYVTLGISDLNRTEIRDGIDEDSLVVSTVSSAISEGAVVVPNLTNGDGTEEIPGVINQNAIKKQMNGQKDEEAATSESDDDPDDSTEQKDE